MVSPFIDLQMCQDDDLDRLRFWFFSSRFQFLYGEYEHTECVGVVFGFFFLFFKRF